MTTLHDPFDTLHKRDLKNREGRVIDQLDYVTWSQVADRLDAAEPGWSFEVLQIGTDWCLGQLRFADGRVYQNVGYAENADQAWKKEPLKDAVSDALKRCAALAGVARYLYDRDGDGPQPRHNGPQQPPAPRPLPVPPPAEEDAEWAALYAQAEKTEDPFGVYGDRCPKHDRPWKDTARGTKCTANDGTRETPDWCKYHPTKRWLAEREVAR